MAPEKSAPSLPQAAPAFEGLPPYPLAQVNPDAATSAASVQPASLLRQPAPSLRVPSGSLQANAESALSFGLDVWNLYAGWLGNSSFAPTMEFFNRHAGQKNPATAQAAFLSFRDSLETADTKRFPVAQFGPVDNSRNPSEFANVDRMAKIAKVFSDHGARLGQKGAASSKNGVHQKKANALIDVCWECHDGNYQQHLRQLHTLNTSVGWWQLGPVNESFGRFARGLEQASGKTEMTLELDPKFAARGGTALVRVAFYDLSAPSRGG